MDARNNDQFQWSVWNKLYSDWNNGQKVTLGPHYSYLWNTDPKMLAFSLSRYKFVAKMLEGKKAVLEIGCGEAFCSSIVAGCVGSLTCVDIEESLISFLTEYRSDTNVSFKTIDYTKQYISPFDAIYCLDVFEHLESQEAESNFLSNIISSLNNEGVFVVGLPSLESQQYSSELIKESHVNCKSGVDLRKTLESYFSNVFLFSMNDEVVHTGFSPMAHYLIALCTNPVKDKVNEI